MMTSRPSRSAARNVVMSIFFRWSEGRYAIVEDLDPRLIELQRLEQEGEAD